VSDEQGAPATSPSMMRRITWINPDDGEDYVYLTNEMTLAPGLIVLIFRRRWDVEKVFDEFKNKLNETKSWASSVSAKCAQANALCLAHNLMVLFEHRSSKEQGITNQAEINRRARRLIARTAQAAEALREMPVIISRFQRLTVRSVKFVRLLRKFMFLNRPLDLLYDNLRLLYAEM